MLRDDYFRGPRIIRTRIKIRSRRRPLLYCGSEESSPPLPFSQPRNSPTLGRFSLFRAVRAIHNRARVRATSRRDSGITAASRQFTRSPLLFPPPRRFPLLPSRHVEALRAPLAFPAPVETTPSVRSSLVCAPLLYTSSYIPLVTEGDRPSAANSSTTILSARLPQKILRVHSRTRVLVRARARSSSLPFPLVVDRRRNGATKLIFFSSFFSLFSFVSSLFLPLLSRNRPWTK